ncbi:MAG: photosystem II stability/assembly factor-like uncharacterized protein [Nitrospinales bacterium]
MNIRLFKKNRNFHKWAGLICGAFILILSVSGFLLMHPEEFGIQKAQITGKYLPSKYFNVQRVNLHIQALLVPSSASQTIFVGTNIGVYRSQDLGISWKQINQGLFDQNIRTLSLHPDFPKTIYAGTALGIFKSEDEGETWNEWIDESSGLTHPKIHDLSIDAQDSDIIFAATEGGIYKSFDSGESWDVLYDETPVLQIESSTINPNIIYAVTSKNMIRSNDGGENWKDVWQDDVTNPLLVLALNTDPEFLYSGTQTGLLKSFNTGRNWVVDQNFSGTPVTAGYVYANNLSHLLFGSGEKIFRSNDGGDSWLSLASLVFGRNEGTSITHTLTQIETLGERIILAGTTSGLFISKDEGRSWENINLSGAANQLSPSEMKMDVVKLITEIHNGRFFGSFFILLVDIATLGLIFLTLSGVLIAYYQSRVKKRKILQSEPDEALQRRETADVLAVESEEIHDMIEHITEHIEKCGLVYMDQEKKEISEVSRHLTTLDKKMHSMMERLKELENTN